MAKSSQLVTHSNQRQCYLDDVISTVLKIIDADGPLPMRNLRPTKKTRNAVDHFRETHQAEYDARSVESGDRVERVNKHNSAYPKLRDELDRRRSTAKVNVCEMACICKDCVTTNKIKKRKETAANKPKRRRTYERKCNKNNCIQNTRKKITKKRTNRKDIIELFNRYKMKMAREKAGTGVTCSAVNVKKVYKMAPKAEKHSNDVKAKPLDMDVDDDLVTIYSAKNCKSSRTRSDVSKSTYNSFPSTDHELIV